MSGRQDHARIVRGLAQLPPEEQASVLLQVMSAPGSNDAVIKRFAELLVESLTGDMEIERLLAGLAPLRGNPQIKELIKQMLVVMPKDQAERFFEMAGTKMPTGIRVLRALHQL